METKKQYASCVEAQQLDLVAYLSSLGYQPVRVRNADYWYLSPLREEKTASFKINQKLNCWYDHGLGQGGNLIDFAIRYYGCSVSAFLQHLKGTLSFQPPVPPFSAAGSSRGKGEGRRKGKPANHCPGATALVLFSVPLFTAAQHPAGPGEKVLPGG